MSNGPLHWNRSILIGSLFLWIAFTGCAATGEVKGGGTIIGNPTMPTLPAVPEIRQEDPLQEDTEELMAECEIRKKISWTHFFPATFSLPVDPFKPILTRLGMVKHDLNDAYDLYVQYYLWANLIAEL